MSKSSLSVVEETYNGLPSVKVGGHIIEHDQVHLEKITAALSSAAKKSKGKKIFITQHEETKVHVGGRGSGIIRHIKSFLKKNFKGGCVELEVPSLIRSNGGQKIVRP